LSETRKQTPVLSYVLISFVKIRNVRQSVTAGEPVRTRSSEMRRSPQLAILLHTDVVWVAYITGAVGLFPCDETSET